MKTFNRKVYDIVAQIPEGKVMSYGHVAKLAGNARASRAVGYAMHAAKASDNLPCHRVVFKDGSLSKAFIADSKHRQYELLKKENISFHRGRKVNMKKHAWTAYNIKLQFFH